MNWKDKYSDKMKPSKKMAKVGVIKIEVEKEGKEDKCDECGKMGKCKCGGKTKMKMGGKTKKC